MNVFNSSKISGYTSHIVDVKMSLVFTSRGNSLTTGLLVTPLFVLSLADHTSRSFLVPTSSTTASFQLILGPSMYICTT